MKIAYVLDDTLDKTDGVQQAVLTIGEKMRSLGHDVHYIVTTTERTDIPNVHPVASYISLSFNGNSVRTPRPVSRKRIKALLRTEQFDVIHVQMPFSPLLAGRVINNAPVGTKIIGTFHILPYNTITALGTKLLGLIVRRTLKKFHTFYAVSQPAADFMEHTFHVKATVLGNPIDYNFFHDQGKKSRIATSKQQRIVFVGRFDERKGVLQLIRAVAESTHARSADIIMCGKGPLHEQAQTLASQLDLKVDFPGFVSEEEKAAQLGSATIAVFPSISGESFGIVLIEAMASGAEATIGGNNPGYTSVLQSWPDTLFDPDNTNAFAALLDKLLSEAEVRHEIGAQQHEAVKAYASDAIASTLLTQAYNA